jgi:phenylpropionate dioxygenase-like ring-hydroxylating dioxygenase large terminal subunit
MVRVKPSVNKMAEMSMTIPWDWYRDPAVLAREEEVIFRGAWHYVGRLGKAGDVVPGWAGRVPVVLVKGEDEERAFVNVCRHRGSVIVEEPGNRKTLQCAYHAWTYGLDGSLRAAPRSEREGLDLSEISLVPVRLEGWGPFRFVNLDDDALPLAELLADIPERIAEGGLNVDALAFHHRVDWEVAANWKIACENFLECYHCPVAHPSFSKLIDVDPDAYLLESEGFVSSQFGPLRASANGDKLPYEPHGEVKRAQYHFVWPNLTINIEPGPLNLSLDSWRPVGPHELRGGTEYFFGEDVSDEEAREIMSFGAQVGAEDMALVASVQEGLDSGMVPNGRLLTSSEHLIQHFQRLVFESLR